MDKQRQKDHPTVEAEAVDFQQNSLRTNVRVYRSAIRLCFSTGTKPDRGELRITEGRNFCITCVWKIHNLVLYGV